MALLEDYVEGLPAIELDDFRIHEEAQLARFAAEAEAVERRAYETSFADQKAIYRIGEELTLEGAQRIATKAGKAKRASFERGGFGSGRGNHGHSLGVGCRALISFDHIRSGDVYHDTQRLIGLIEEQNGGDDELGTREAPARVYRVEHDEFRVDTVFGIDLPQGGYSGSIMIHPVALFRSVGWSPLSSEVIFPDRSEGIAFDMRSVLEIADSAGALWKNHGGAAAIG